MSGLKELRRRQKTAMVIERMTGAMRMISRARYTALQNEMRKSEGLCPSLQALANRIVAAMAGAGTPCSVPYAKQGPEDAPYLLVLMTSDAGLCGGFNQKLIKAALEWLAERKNERIQVLCIGKKGLHVLQKKPGITLSSYEESPGNWKDHVISLFKNKSIRGCHIVSGRFFNILTQEPQIVPILPALGMGGGGITAQQSRQQHNGGLEQEGEVGRLITIEPDANSVLNAVLELLIHASLKKMTQEHAISEYAARMNAMDSANDNAKDMIRRLQIQYNRLRQDRITKEIIEIVSGSEAAAHP